ncbi:hypothetical protein EDD15DRAFT_2282949, partial [Pisolithus albus]
YQLMNTRCYWFVAAVFEASKRLFPGAKQDITKHNGGSCYWIRIPQKSSVDVVCGEYKTAQTALDAEIEEERRVEQEVREEARRREIAELRAAAEREREQCRAADEQYRAADEQRRAAEEGTRREREQRQAAEEENAKLRRELEASRANQL